MHRLYVESRVATQPLQPIPAHAQNSGTLPLHWPIPHPPPPHHPTTTITTITTNSTFVPIPQPARPSPPKNKQNVHLVPKNHLPPFALVRQLPNNLDNHLLPARTLAVPRGPADALHPAHFVRALAERELRPGRARRHGGRAREDRAGRRPVVSTRCGGGRRHAGSCQVLARRGECYGADYAGEVGAGDVAG